MLSNHFRAQEFLEKINKPPLWAQALNVAGEAGEFAEAYRRYTGNARRVSDSNEVMEELADVVISAYVFAELFGHSLDTAISSKWSVILSAAMEINLDPLDIQFRKPRSDKLYVSHAEQMRHHRLNRKREFIGIDGEGVTREDGTHDYVLLSVGGESYHENDTPLTTQGIFEFLWDRYLESPNAVFVGFYLGYDFTMWLKGLPENRARMLLSRDGISKRVRKKGRNPVPFPVEWQGWEFDMLGFKRFKLRRAGHSSWMYINDAGPFFQTSFLNVIDPKNWPGEPICTDDEYEIIRAGKTRRDVAAFDKDMIRYNVLENEVLARVMTKYDEGLKQVGVNLSRARWFGPGQAAQSWLNLIKAPDNDVANFNVPPEVLNAARASYYGGWFEITCHGPIPGRTYEYDRNSAYPYATSRLPCLEHGRWVHGDSGFRGSGGHPCLVYASVRGSHRVLGTMPCRTREGAILRPHNVKGWYWWHEIRAAQTARCIDMVSVHESWSYEQACNHAPFQAIADLYLQRINVGKDTPFGKALKTVYNSVYGKIAQSVGDPRYANPVYASLITSDCRTAIWDTIATHPDGADAVTMVATDGIFFRSPHPVLSLTDKLGDWSVETHDNLTQFMPGLYWDDRVRKDPVKGKVKSRGVSASDLKEVIDRVERKWEICLRVVTENPPVGEIQAIFGDDAGAELAKAWPYVGVPIRFPLVSAKLAVHRNNWRSAGTLEWDTDGDGERCLRKRYLSGDPSEKRDVSARYVDTSGFLRSMPYDMGPDGLDTVPYDKTFGIALRELIGEVDLITEGDDEMGEIYDVLYRGLQ